MTIDRPWALALLAVPVVLLWLRLRDARPREAEASSLLVWRRVAPADAAPRRPRPPIAAWVEAVGAVLIVLAVANPVLEGVAPPFVRVLLDASPSMQRGLAAARAAIGGRAQTEEAPDLEGRMPAAIAQSTPLVVVTDHRLPAFPDDPPRLRVVGVGKPGFNAGITAASGVPLGAGRWRLSVTVEAFGARGPVEGSLVLGDSKERITLTAGAPLEVTRETQSGIADVRIEFTDDVLAADDRVGLKAVGGEPVRAGFDAALRDSPLVRAIDAAGAELEEAAGSDAAIRLEPVAAGTAPAVEVHLPDNADGPEVSGARVTTGSSELVRDLRIDPAVTLGRRPGGLVKVPTVLQVKGAGTVRAETLLADDQGPLAVCFPSVNGARPVHFLFQPGGSWVERDPSFVVFVKNLVDFAAGGPARVEATGMLDPAETRQAAEGETFGDLDEALAAAARPDVSAGYSAAPLLLGLAAAALALAWWLARG